MVKQHRAGNTIRLSAEDKVFNAVIYTLATFFLLICAYPLIYVVSASS